MASKKDRGRKGNGSSDKSPVRQLTLSDWEEAQTTVSSRGSQRGQTDLASLAAALAPRLADELTARIPAPPQRASETARLMTLDELVAELPRAKRPATWKRWLYERTRRGEVPGCVKIGGMLFFEREPALEWLRAGATSR
ncbi:MAG: hypothetical protein M3327_08485 [Actinomycetota bacterium]|nr:hypothetical protein [Actinomycetota bacterium]